MKFIKRFREVGLDDVTLVGGKTASIGQMLQQLTAENIRVPDGFAVTVDGYYYHLKENHLIEKIQQELTRLDDPDNLSLLRSVGQAIRDLIYQAPLPRDLAQEIVNAYRDLEEQYEPSLPVAVRSSATAEDLPHASFAGQQETYLGIAGDDELLDACKKCMASLFTDRAIVYRIQHNFEHMRVGLSVAVQKLVRSGKACSGVLFTIDTETGFPDIVLINSSVGFGESIVKGLVVPDEFIVHKPTLVEGYRPIIDRSLGNKELKIIFEHGKMQEMPTDEQERSSFTLNDEEILELARAGVVIENHYSDKRDAWTPMDIEWAKDSVDGKLYIVQARPETVHAHRKLTELVQYVLQASNPTILLSGTGIGRAIVSGKVRVASSIAELETFREGDVLVTGMTDPDWVPVMKRAAGIITDRGGRTCHAAIVSRELGIPAIIGTHEATQILKNDQPITLDCSGGMTGYIYEGILPFEINRVPLESLKKPPVELMINLGDPGAAFQHSFLPVDGVGLMRIEFIMSNINIHPMAIVEPQKISEQDRNKIEQRATGYDNPRLFFIDKLAQDIGKIAAAFYPRHVTVRLSDFKSNEYRNLLGGKNFEPCEQNPMIGFRGAFRYIHKAYAPAFALECEAVKKVRDDMGLKNVRVMIPFVRTITEAQRVLEELEKNGLTAGKDELEIFMMVEVPSNVLLIEDFCKYFDGVSIGSNDLTQLVLGVDRDSALLEAAFDERDPAVKKALALTIEGAHRARTYVSICGQAPSDYPEIADFLIEHGIDSLSLNPDAIVPFLQRLNNEPND